jgi:DNA-binding transcriptional regulator YiaG
VGLRPFYDRFLASPLSHDFASGFPKIVAGTSGAELVYDVYGKKLPDIPGFAALKTAPEYWAGWALCYYQWYSTLSFQEIEENVPVEKVVAMFDPYHEMDIHQFCDHLNRLLSEKNPETALKRARQRMGISQAELSRRSQIPKRTLQQYEQRQKDINKAIAETLFALSKVLGCPMEELLERIPRPKPSD